MNDIFANLYNKVLGFFRQSDKEENAKDIACNRLRVVLMQDRTNLTPELMVRMRKELVELLSKYVEMDKEALELNLEQDGEQMALMLSIPVLRARDEEEIADCELKAQSSEDSEAEDPLTAGNNEEAELAKEDSATKEKAAEDESDDDEEEELESEDESLLEDNSEEEEVEEADEYLEEEVVLEEKPQVKNKK